MQLAALMLIAASYSIDSAHSSVGFAVKHLMVSTARGQFDRVTGRVEIDDADLTANGKLLASGNLTIQRVTRPVTLTIDSIAPPSKAPWGTWVRGATATGKLSGKDFGLRWNKRLQNGGVVVSDEVQLTIYRAGGRNEGPAN
jgi:polyisoprenoid-binding protein YceI